MLLIPVPPNQWHALDQVDRSVSSPRADLWVTIWGQVGEQATMFLFDPCGNALEFKAFKDIGQFFAK